MFCDLALCIAWYIFRILCKFEYIQACSLSIPTYSTILWQPCAALAYSKPSSIQNYGIFRTQGIFRTPSSHDLRYSERCLTLVYWEPFHIQNFAIFRIFSYLGRKSYSESCLYRHIQAYSIMVVIITLSFFLSL